MKFKNVKVGDIIKIKIRPNRNEDNFRIFNDEQWKVIKIYEHIVTAQSVKCPAIRRSFSYGDLVVLGIEGQYMSR